MPVSTQYATMEIHNRADHLNCLPVIRCPVFFNHAYDSEKHAAGRDFSGTADLSVAGSYRGPGRWTGKYSTDQRAAPAGRRHTERISALFSYLSDNAPVYQAQVSK